MTPQEYQNKVLDLTLFFDNTLDALRAQMDVLEEHLTVENAQGIAEIWDRVDKRRIELIELLGGYAECW